MSKSEDAEHVDRKGCFPLRGCVGQVKYNRKRTFLSWALLLSSCGCNRAKTRSLSFEQIILKFAYAFCRSEEY